ncbi:PRTRC system protein E [Acidithiobacillus thiooxidans]|uniref:PRTRC system protein E n=1 Tax=Acidithiobacillus thiooxidans TaxID=930 RepID=UPI001C078867|nr:PRTRC system protein E [Acidithiobacillus thiooxidans]MBU2750586.1 PRTRC system protein E [Acidithiobacillus thiooxidans]
MFFDELAELLKDYAVTTMVFSMDGERMRINVLPKASEGKSDPIPLSLCASPAELNVGFMDAMKSYRERIASLAEQVAEFEKQAQAAAKEAAEKAKAKTATPAKTPAKKPEPAAAPQKAKQPAEDLGDLF